MYNDYFGFTEKPFSIAPNPRYLFMSQQHEEALAHLLYGIKEGNGFVLLTGEVGTGKTTLCNCLLEQLPADTNVAYILNPKVSVKELLATLCDEFNIEYQEPLSNKILIDKINDFLLKAHAANRNIVLIIDEAQNLSNEVLEQVRLLTNLETYEKKLLQIILIGQPELREKFFLPELRQLAQRITARFHLRPLSKKEVKLYINHRLNIAGSKTKIFKDNSSNRVHKLTGGIPRLINLVCDRALLAAYTQNKKQVNVNIINSAAAEVLYQNNAANSNWRKMTIPTGVFISAAIFLGILWLSINPQTFRINPTLNQTQTTAQHETNTSITTPQPAVVKPINLNISGANIPVPQRTQATATESSATIDLGTTALTTPDSPLTTEPLTEEPSQIANNITLPAHFTTDQSRLSAFQRLLSLWNINYGDINKRACTLAQEHDLRCLQDKSNFGILEKLGRPAILRLVNQDGKEFYITLESIHEHSIEIYTADSLQHVSRNALDKFWYGDFTMLWRPPSGYRGHIDASNPGPHGPWLQQQLAQLELVDEQNQGFLYIAPLEQQVKKFQIKYGLDPDGIVGAHTLILLNSVLGSAAPSLTAATPAAVKKPQQEPDNALDAETDGTAQTSLVKPTNPSPVNESAAPFTAEAKES